MKASKSNKTKLGQNSLITVDSIDELSPRELEVMYLVSLGFKSKEIALFLGLSPKTIDDHVYKIKLKYNFMGNKKKLSEYMVDEKKLHHYLPVTFLMYAKKINQLISP